MQEFGADIEPTLGQQKAQLPRANAVITPFKVIQGHWFWHQSKARMRLHISE